MKATRVCQVDDCERPAKCRGYCKTHYSRWLRTGVVEDYPIQRDRTCSVDGCDKKHFGHGYCAMHHARLARHNDVTAERRRGPKSCRVDGCERSVEARALCKMHYSRWWEGRDIGGPEPLNLRPAICTVDGCERAHSRLGYCSLHARRFKAYGDPLVVKLVHGGDGIGYGAAHDRVKRRWGSASWYRCEHCSGEASDWAYDHDDPDARIVWHLGSWLLISLDPEHYLPLCRKCHRQFDGNRL